MLHAEESRFASRHFNGQKSLVIWLTHEYEVSESLFFFSLGQKCTVLGGASAGWTSPPHILDALGLTFALLSLVKSTKSRFRKQKCDCFYKDNGEKTSLGA